MWLTIVHVHLKTCDWYTHLQLVCILNHYQIVFLSVLSLMDRKLKKRTTAKPMAASSLTIYEVVPYGKQDLSSTTAEPEISACILPLICITILTLMETINVSIYN